MAKKSFVIHVDSLSVLDDLTDIQVATFFRALKSYHEGTMPELDPLMKIVFTPFKNQFIRDDANYEKTCERNKRNAEARWEKEQAARNNGIPPNATGISGTSSHTKNADNDSDSDNDNDSKSDSDNENLKRRVKFIKPTLNEVEDYFLGIGAVRAYKTEALKFINHYESNGWKVGKNKMSNWKSAVSGWWARYKENNPSLFNTQTDFVVESEFFQEDKYVTMGLAYCKKIYGPNWKPNPNWQLPNG